MELLVVANKVKVHRGKHHLQPKGVHQLQHLDRHLQSHLLALLHQSREVLPEDLLENPPVGLLPRELTGDHQVLLKAGQCSFLKHLHRQLFVKPVENLLLRVDELAYLLVLTALLKLPPALNSLYLPPLHRLSQVCQSADGHLDEEKAQALIVGVVVRLDEILSQMAQKGIQVPFVQDYSAVPPDPFDPRSLYQLHLSPGVRLLLFYLLLCLCGHCLHLDHVLFVLPF